MAYLPPEDFDRARATTALALRLGARALMVRSRCPCSHGPSHEALQGCSEAERGHFCADNFIDLMGAAALQADPVRTTA